MTTIRERIMFWGSIAVLALAGIIMICIFFWAFYPYHIIDFELPIPIMNENNQVIRGDKLHIRTTYNKHLQVNGNGTSVIICEDGNLVTVLPPRTVGVAFPLGKHTIDFDMTVPDKTSLGNCSFESVINYKINPIREIPITIYSDTFEVID